MFAIYKKSVFVEFLDISLNIHICLHDFNDMASASQPINMYASNNKTEISALFLCILHNLLSFPIQWIFNSNLAYFYAGCR